MGYLAHCVARKIEVIGETKNASSFRLVKKRMTIDLGKKKIGWDHSTGRERRREVGGGGGRPGCPSLPAG